MPNQRSSDKTFLGGYLDKRLNGKIELLAEREGMGDNKFGFAVRLMREAIQRREGRERVAVLMQRVKSRESQPVANSH